MNQNLYTGKLTRLDAASPDAMGQAYAKWSRDTEFMQLWDTEAPMLRDVKKTQEWFTSQEERHRHGSYNFMIRTLADDHLIGMTSLFDANTAHHNAWVAIGIGERDYWGKGYGTDAMNLILAFGFLELNLHRVNLFTFSINPRAIRSYEKVGFVHEGVIRQAMRRYGKRGDFVSMGILRSEWERIQNA
ncbi:MAG: GNAT family N-acetyltransferase [Anaerolineae bacterium]|nr:GNAT family N-acetyltransferase [Anaerolineae bacterium]